VRNGAEISVSKSVKVLAPGIRQQKSETAMTAGRQEEEGYMEMKQRRK